MTCKRRQWVRRRLISPFHTNYSKWIHIAPVLIWIKTNCQTSTIQSPQLIYWFTLTFYEEHRFITPSKTTVVYKTTADANHRGFLNQAWLNHDVCVENPWKRNLDFENIEVTPFYLARLYHSVCVCVCRNCLLRVRTDLLILFMYCLCYCQKGRWRNSFENQKLCDRC